jgi:hypothetical protein
MEPPVHDDEHFLQQIFQVALADPHSLKGSPDEVGVRDHRAPGSALRS